MLNQTLKNKIAPWQEHGRWYKAFVESDGTDYTLTSCDLEDASVASGILKMPKDFHVVDAKFDINIDSSAAFTFTNTFKGYADGKQGITLPNVANFDYCTLYFFGYFKA